MCWLFTGLENLLGIWMTSGTPGHHGGITRQLGIGYGLVETPLVLLAFALAKEGRGRKGLLLLLLLFLAGELIMVRLRGSRDSLLPIMASGLAIIILCSL